MRWDTASGAWSWRTVWLSLALAAPVALAQKPLEQTQPERAVPQPLDAAQAQQLIADLERMGLHDAANRIRNNNALAGPALPIQATVRQGGRGALPFEPPLDPPLRAPEAVPPRIAPSAVPTVSMPVATPAPIQNPQPSQPGQAFELMRDNGGWIHVRGFEIIHSKRFPDAELQTVLKDFVNRELNVPQLKYAAALLANYYRARGIGARALVPEQSLDQGIVKIQILESPARSRTKGQ